jgi:hypothetical protein
MGGQACILYGGAEFSRDIDLSIGIGSQNLEAVRKALDRLRAEAVFFPSLNSRYLRRGHACHFRCRAKGMEGLRIDLMAKMRGCPGFERLWARRTIVHLPGVGEIGVLSLADLVQAKKTQREKDWPMIARLIETDLTREYPCADRKKLAFWLKECRTPFWLMKLAREHKELCAKLASRRRVLRAALKHDTRVVRALLLKEESGEKKRDWIYWKPLRKDLEHLRHERISSNIT